MQKKRRVKEYKKGWIKTSFYSIKDVIKIKHIIEKNVNVDLFHKLYQKLPNQTCFPDGLKLIFSDLSERTYFFTGLRGGAV